MKTEGLIEGLKAEFQGFTMLYEIECSFLVIIAQECASTSDLIIINKKMHKISYHTVNHWKEACTPFLPGEFVSFHQIMFTGQVACMLFEPIARFQDRSLITTGFFFPLRRSTVDTMEWQVANKIGYIGFHTKMSYWWLISLFSEKVLSA